jgi:hypothetical protein
MKKASKGVIVKLNPKVKEQVKPKGKKLFSSSAAPKKALPQAKYGMSMGGAKPKYQIGGSPIKKIKQNVPGEYPPPVSPSAKSDSITKAQKANEFPKPFARPKKIGGAVKSKMKMGGSKKSC